MSRANSACSLEAGVSMPPLNPLYAGGPIHGRTAATDIPNFVEGMKRHEMRARVTASARATRALH